MKLKLTRKNSVLRPSYIKRGTVELVIKKQTTFNTEQSNKAVELPCENKNNVQPLHLFALIKMLRFIMCIQISLEKAAKCLWQTSSSLLKELSQ